MLVAVLSDIHSNVFALEAVLRDVSAAGVDEIWVGGDTFGYYPWAADTFSVLQRAQPVGVLGNHDEWVGHSDAAPADVVGAIARHNARDLDARAPSALGWVRSLTSCRQLRRDRWKITLVHGTPDDPLEGRYYPDDRREYPWLPQASEILVLGQTHHPMLRVNSQGGVVLNPGSVGQPRDGNPMPSWALLDLRTGRAELRRTAYDNAAVISRLRALGWDRRIATKLGRT